MSNENTSKEKSKELLSKALDVLNEYVDDEPCYLDHHGYCQTHYWLDDSECINIQAKKLIDEIQQFLKDK